MVSAESFSHIIESRRTTKEFNGDAPSRSLIEKYLNLANWAPNHHLNQPWRFRVLTQSGIQKWSTHIRSHLSPEEQGAFGKYFTRLPGAGVIILVTSQKAAQEILQMENYAATCCAIQNLLLAATADGWHSFWSTSRLFLHRSSLEFFNITEAEELYVGAIWLGHGKTTEPKTRRPASELTTWFE